MKFCTKDNKEIGITVSIESDGCALVNANGVNVIRFTNDGKIARITNGSTDVTRLKLMGFKMEGSQVEVLK